MATIIDLPQVPMGADLDQQKRYLYRLREELNVVLNGMDTSARKLAESAGGVKAQLEEQILDRWKATRDLISKDEQSTGSSIQALEDRVTALETAATELAQSIRDLANDLFGSYQPQTPGVTELGQQTGVHGPLYVDDPVSGHLLTLGTTSLTEASLRDLLGLPPL